MMLQITCKRCRINAVQSVEQAAGIGGEVLQIKFLAKIGFV
jgi:hypothetical protein